MQKTPLRLATQQDCLGGFIGAGGSITLGGRHKTLPPQNLRSLQLLPGKFRPGGKLCNAAGQIIILQLYKDLPTPHSLAFLHQDCSHLARAAGSDRYLHTGLYLATGIDGLHRRTLCRLANLNQPWSPVPP
ncbi:hypothetical protein GCM10007907_18620 [Chitinimonas prasina]|uniref:Uncharacterized protein n=1 Tax=Chitinimonas prasina TaxID=1434937 RepID=A0ABQ5YF16_9NEIS|nr:hypothetical protein GCM10007907_18620 [Chitinimonas prasina]